MQPGAQLVRVGFPELPSAPLHGPGTDGDADCRRSDDARQPEDLPHPHDPVLYGSDERIDVLGRGRFDHPDR